MVNFYKTINEAFDKRYDSNTKKPLTEASAAHAHPDMSKKAGSISSMILSNKDRIDSATSLQDLRAVVEDILSPLEGNAKVTEINGRLRAMKDHVKALQYIYNIILKGDNLGTIKTGKAKERSKNESCGKKRSKKLTENSNKIFKLDRNYSWSIDGKNHPLYPIVMDILDDMGLFMKVSRGSCFFRQQFTNDAAGAMSCADFAEAMDALTRASNGKSMVEVYDNVEDFLWSDCISMDYKWHHDDGETYDFDTYDESFRRRRVNESYGNIFSMPFAKYSKMSGYTEDDISLHPEKNVVRVYLLDLGDGEDGPYTGVEYDDGTFSVVGLGYDSDVNSKEKMKQIVLSGMDEIMDESFRRRRVNESKRKLKEAKNDGIFSMTLSEYADSQGVDAKEAESWVTLHPEKTISKLYFSEDEESPYTGVVYTDGTISVVGLRYDDDVKDFSTMRKVLLSGSEDIFESKRKLNKKKRNVN